MKHINLLRALFVSALFATGLTIATPALAAEDCSAADDVTVIIDYKDLGSETQVLCAEGAGGKSAFEVLGAAGVELQGTADYGDAVVCRVNGLPDEQTETCETFSATAYWAISISEQDKWLLAEMGVQDQVVAGGTFLGLSYEPITTDAPQSQGPGIAPTAESRASLSVAESDAESDSEDDNSMNLLWPIVGVLVVVGAVAIFMVSRRGGSKSD